jgi:hypothetical protein
MSLWVMSVIDENAGQEDVYSLRYARCEGCHDQHFRVEADLNVGDQDSWYCDDGQFAGYVDCCDHPPSHKLSRTVCGVG